MKILAENIHRPIWKTIVVLFLLLFITAFLLAEAIVAEYWEDFTACLYGIGSCMILIFIAIHHLESLIRHNKAQTVVVWLKKNQLCCIRKNEIWEVPCKDIYSVQGKNKKYFHFYGRFWTAGIRNYGKLKIYYYENNHQCKLVLRNIHEPEYAATAIYEAVQQASMVEPLVDYYEILGIRRKATAEKIEEAYAQLRDEPDPHGMRRMAYEVLSDPYKRGRYDERLAARENYF